MFTSRVISTSGLLLAVASMAFAVGYLQMVEYLEPCPLCVLDRAVVIGLGVVFLLALLHNPRKTGRRIYAALATVLSITGIAICWRHIWLQNLPPDQVPECGAGFWYMLDSMPFAQFLDTILNGSGECADIQWQFLGFSIPEWTLVLFVVFLGLSLLLFFSRSAKDLVDYRP
jgi:disulfide bond formation protein DsbB